MSNIIERFKVESESTAGRFYTASKIPHFAINGDHEVVIFEWQCSCVGWTRHVPRRDCKHIEWVKRFGATPIEPLVWAAEKVLRKERRKTERLVVA